MQGPTHHPTHACLESVVGGAAEERDARGDGELHHAVHGHQRRLFGGLHRPTLAVDVLRLTGGLSCGEGNMRT